MLLIGKFSFVILGAMMCGAVSVAGEGVSVSVRPLESFFFVKEPKMVEVTVRNELDTIVGFERNYPPFFHRFSFGKEEMPRDYFTVTSYKQSTKAVLPRSEYKYIVCLDRYLKFEEAEIYDITYRCVYVVDPRGVEKKESKCSFVVDVREGEPRERLIESCISKVQLEPRSSPGGKEEESARVALEALIWTDHPMAVGGLIDARRYGVGPSSDIDSALFKFFVQEIRDERLVEFVGYEKLFSDCKAVWHKPSVGYMEWLADRGSVEENVSLLEFIIASCDPDYWDVALRFARGEDEHLKRLAHEALNSLQNVKYDLLYLQR